MCCESFDVVRFFFFFYLSFLFSYKGYKECNILTETQCSYTFYFLQQHKINKEKWKKLKQVAGKKTSDAPGKKRKQTPTILKFLVGKGDNCQILLFLIFLFEKYLEGSKSRRGIIY